MDADTEVYAHLSAISGHVAMLVMMVDQGPAAQSPLPGLVGELARCTEAARQALLLRASEQQVQARVHELVQAAGLALAACLHQGGVRESPSRLLDQIHTEANELALRLKARAAPLPSAGAAGPAAR